MPDAARGVSSRGSSVAFTQRAQVAFDLRAGGPEKRSTLTLKPPNPVPKLPYRQYKIPAVIDSHRFNLHTADAALKLEILTIGFHENAREWLRQNSSWPHVVLVCFAIKSSDSFVSVVQQWMPVVRQYNPRTPIILVGCQKDYRDEDDGSLMTVDTAEALEYSAQIGAAAYIECSAQTGEGLIEVFGAVARVAVAAGLTG